MAFIHTTRPLTRRVMLSVLLASLPGLGVLCWFFGLGYVPHLALCCLFCVGFEAVALGCRQRPVLPALQDGSAWVTGWLLGLALPPSCPIAMLVLGCFVAIVLTKQLYGGLGFNRFNPAMVAYALLLVCFPREMNLWPSPRGLLAAGFWEAWPPWWAGTRVDAIASATALDLVKHNQGYTLQDLYALRPQLALAHWAGRGWEWVNLGFLGGGLWLLQQRIIRWQAPAGMLFSLGLLSALGYDNGSSNSTGSPLLHLLSGATMLGAFFIITDPVTSPASPRGRLLFGLGVGALVFVIRVWGQYPEGLAFAVLLMNLAVPAIDRLTPPRSFGHKPLTSTAQSPPPAPKDDCA